MAGHAPAAVLGLMAALGVLQGLVKVLWPTPTVPPQDGGDLPTGAAAAPRGASATPAPKPPPAPGKVSRFLV